MLVFGAVGGAWIPVVSSLSPPLSWYLYDLWAKF